MKTMSMIIFLTAHMASASFTGQRDHNGNAFHPRPLSVWEGTIFHPHQKGLEHPAIDIQLGQDQQDHKIRVVFDYTYWTWHGTVYDLERNRDERNIFYLELRKPEPVIENIIFDPNDTIPWSDIVSVAERESEEQYINAIERPKSYFASKIKIRSGHNIMPLKEFLER